MQWQEPSTVNTSPAIQTRQGKLPTFSALCRRRDYGRTGDRSNGTVLLPYIPAKSLWRSTSCCDRASSAIGDGTQKRLSTQLHFRLPFCLRSACRANDTPALRTHALLPKIRSAPFRRGRTIRQTVRARTTAQHKRNRRLSLQRRGGSSLCPQNLGPVTPAPNLCQCCCVGDGTKLSFGFGLLIEVLASQFCCLRLLAGLLHIPKWRGSKETAVFTGEL